MPTVSEYIQYRWLPRTARGIDVVSRKIIPVVADALATFGVSSVVAAKAIGEQGRTGFSLDLEHIKRHLAMQTCKAASSLSFDPLILHEKLRDMLGSYFMRGFFLTNVNRRDPS